MCNCVRASRAAAADTRLHAHSRTDTNAYRPIRTIHAYNGTALIVCGCLRTAVCAILAGTVTRVIVVIGAPKSV